MRVIPIVLLLVLAGCAGSQQVVQNGPICYSYGEEKIRFMRATHNLPPRECRCDQLAKVKFLEPLTDWKGDIKQTDFYACPMSKEEGDYDSRVARMPLSESPFATFVPPAIHGLAFLGGTLGGSVILGSAIRNQNFPQPQPAFSDARISTLNTFQSTPPGFVLK